MLNIITSVKTKVKGNDGTVEIEEDKAIGSMLLDSLIIALITVLSLWTGEMLYLEQLLPLIKAFGLSFVVQLAWYRGIKKAE